MFPTSITSPAAEKSGSGAWLDLVRGVASWWYPSPAAMSASHFRQSCPRGSERLPINELVINPFDRFPTWCEEVGWEKKKTI